MPMPKPHRRLALTISTDSPSLNPGETATGQARGTSSPVSPTTHGDAVNNGIEERTPKEHTPTQAVTLNGASTSSQAAQKPPLPPGTEEWEAKLAALESRCEHLQMQVEQLEAQVEQLASRPLTTPFRIADERGQTVCEVVSGAAGCSLQLFHGEDTPRTVLTAAPSGGILTLHNEEGAVIGSFGSQAGSGARLEIVTPGESQRAALSVEPGGGLLELKSAAGQSWFLPGWGGRTRRE